MTSRADIRNWRLCVVTDAGLSRGRPVEDVVRAAIAGGADLIQFRDKTSSGRAAHAAAARVLAVCRSAGIPLLINDRVDLALALDADGVHVGQEDLPAEVVRRLIGPARVLGVSATTPDEAVRAVRDGADYLGVGPVFEARSTKPDARAPIGIEGLRAMASRVEVPVLAIGGIGKGNAGDCIAAGATGVAVISAVVATVDVEQAARGLKAAVKGRRV